MATATFKAGYASTARSGCNRCKEKILKGELRIGKNVPNPFSDDGGDRTIWFHAKCMVESFARARATTKIIQHEDDIEGFGDLQPTDQQAIRDHIAESDTQRANTKPSGGQKAKQGTLDTLVGNGLTPKKATRPDLASPAKAKPQSPSVAKAAAKNLHVDSSGGAGHDGSGSFESFQTLCTAIENEPSYLAKTALVESLLEDLEQGDAPATIQRFWQAKKRAPAQSTLSLKDMDKFLDRLTTVTREDEQYSLLKEIVERSTPNDLQYLVRLVKHDHKMNAGSKHILEALHPSAYEAYQSSHDLKAVVEKALSKKGGSLGTLDVRISLMVPVKPMLAEACKSYRDAVEKYPGGILAEVKYDGERVQIHKQGAIFKYFSRSLKPVQPHKVEHITKYLPRALPEGDSLILDAEVLLYDAKNKKPLPFGSLNVHKKKNFQDANVCLYIFDCLFYNGKSLLDRPLKERRKILEEELEVIEGRIELSETKQVGTAAEVGDLMKTCMRDGLEGLVLKSLTGPYEPGKRHWLKMKRDYLADGAMADSADLVVLGAYHGTGNMGGLMSVFLMGCYDEERKVWKTVCKCGNGHDDATIRRLDRDLRLLMKKITRDADMVPKWLLVNKPLVPDYVIIDPDMAPVWEITGAEFSKSTNHTADGISIRFPRVTKIRDDKDAKSATSLKELKLLVKNSGTMAASDEESESTKSDPRPTKRSLPIDTPPKAIKRQKVDTDGSGHKPSKLNRTVTDFFGQKDNKQQKEKPTAQKKAPVSTGEAQKRAGSQWALPDIFSNIIVHMDGVEGERGDHYRRHIVAFNGEVVGKEDSDRATHVVCGEAAARKTNWGGKVVVSDGWLAESLKRMAVAPTASYLCR